MWGSTFTFESRFSLEEYIQMNFDIWLLFVKLLGFIVQW